MAKFTGNPIRNKIFALLLIAGVLMLCGMSLRTQQPSLARVDLEVREAHYRRALGKAHLRSISSFEQEAAQSGFLESFIYQQIEKGLPKSYRGSALEVTNTLIQESNRRGFDPLFILAMIQLESRMNPAVVGRHGEIGLMQILPDTAKWVGQKMGLQNVSRKDLFNPAQNIRVGVAYLSMLDQKYARVAHSVTAYNMGVGNVNRLLARRQQPRVYFSKVLSNYKANYLELESYALTGETRALVAQSN